MERRRAAKQAEGSKIRPQAVAKTAKHSGSLKFYVGDDFRKQHPEWKQTLLDLVDDVNAVLVPSFAVRLETAPMQSWSPRCDGSELQPCLDELAELDAGEANVWVVGVLGAQSRYTDTFEDLGRAFAPGQHMIVRDVSDLAERDAIDQAFPAMTLDRKDEIYKRRKHHKRLAIFLHEWAHTLGAGHSDDSSSLLFPRYDDRMSAYDQASSETVSTNVERRFSEAARVAASAAANDPEPAVRSSAAAAAPGTSGGQNNPYVVRGNEDELLAQLTPADRTLYRSATEQPDPQSVYLTLEPLVARYPENYAVQYLACGMLMQLGRSADVQTVCTRVQALKSKH